MYKWSVSFLLLAVFGTSGLANPPELTEEGTVLTVGVKQPQASWASEFNRVNQLNKKALVHFLQAIQNDPSKFKHITDLTLFGVHDDQREYQNSPAILGHGLLPGNFTHLQKLPCLTTLNLESWIFESSLKSMGQLPNLKNLSLYGVFIDAISRQDLFRQATKEEAGDAWFYTYYAQGNVAARIERLEGTKDIVTRDMRALLALLDKLKKLEIKWAPLTQEDSEYLRQRFGKNFMWGEETILGEPSRDLSLVQEIYQAALAQEKGSVSPEWVETQE